MSKGTEIDRRVSEGTSGGSIEVGIGVAQFEAEVNFRSHYPIDAVELVVNGSVIHREEWPEGRREGGIHQRISADRDGWVAARLWGNARDSFDQSIYAHTSPTYFRCGSPPAERAVGARFFLD